MIFPDGHAGSLGEAPICGDTVNPVTSGYFRHRPGFALLAISIDVEHLPFASLVVRSPLRDFLKNKEQWMELCRQASVEQDSAKLLELVKRINDLLEDKQQRLNKVEVERLDAAADVEHNAQSRER